MKPVSFVFFRAWYSLNTDRAQFVGDYDCTPDATRDINRWHDNNSHRGTGWVTPMLVHPNGAVEAERMSVIARPLSPEPKKLAGDEVAVPMRLLDAILQDQLTLCSLFGPGLNRQDIFQRRRELASIVDEAKGFKEKSP